MIKKTILVLFILLPAVLLSVLLVQNKEKVGTKRDYVEHVFSLEGISCSGCAAKVSQLGNQHIDVKAVDVDAKTVRIRYDQAQVTLEKMNKQLAEHGLTLRYQDQVNVIDYSIKYQ